MVQRKGRRIELGIWMILVSFTRVVVCSFIPRPKIYPNHAVMRLPVTVFSATAEKEAVHQASSLLWNYISNRFQGDFDNYHQVVEDRRQNLLPREGGGHEHIHCTLIPLSNTTRLAAFYFDGIPHRIFRFRYYELVPPPQSNRHSQPTMELRLYTIHPKLETLLRAKSEEPLSWPAIFESFHVDSVQDKISRLPKCEVAWSLEMDPVDHAYALDHSETGQGVHAVMVHGEAILDSTMVPGSKIRVLDQLSLYEDVFYINDRGLDPDTGAFIYGNHRGIPFRLERVCNYRDGERLIVNSDLKWTLGPKFRTEQEYATKMKSIGGPSARMNK